MLILKNIFAEYQHVFLVKNLLKFVEIYVLCYANEEVLALLLDYYQHGCLTVTSYIMLVQRIDLGDKTSQNLLNFLSSTYLRV